MRLIALILLLVALAVGAAMAMSLRQPETQAEVTKYAIQNIRKDTANGNPPNLTGSPDSPGYGRPNVSPDVARYYGR